MISGSPTILHVDMDAFYASVEQRDRPELRGKPVIVGGVEGRGVVCAASYEARPFGVHSAMPMATARRLCPQAVVLPVRMRHYAEIGRQIREVFFAFTPFVEPLSLDEAFLDVRGSEGLFGPAPGIARQIKDRIKTIGQLAALPEQMLVEHFGEGGRLIWQLAHGQDDRSVVPDRDAKSISTETTFAQDLADREVLRTWLLDLVDHLASRLRHVGVRARGIELKIRTSDFRTCSRSQALPEATNLTEPLWQAAAALFERSLTPAQLPVRLLGVGATRLTREALVQGDLFSGQKRERQGALDQAVDAIRDRFGVEAIQRGRLVKRADSRPEDGASG